MMGLGHGSLLIGKVLIALTLPLEALPSLFSSVVQVLLAYVNAYGGIPPPPEMNATFFTFGGKCMFFKSFIPVI
jgi:hypothetical protein